MTDGWPGLVREVRQRWAKNKLLLILLGVLGMALLVLPGSCDRVEQPPDSGISPDYQLILQRELERILSRIQGAGRVMVMVTLEDEQEIVYARNQEERWRSVEEEDSQGGYRETVELDNRGQLVIVRVNNQEQPVVERIIRPRVRGVLIVATGADNPVVRQRLIAAVQSVLDLPAYKISVQKGR